MRILYCIVALGVSFAAWAAPAGSLLEARSENGRFSAETSTGTEISTLLVAVFRQEGEAKTLIWTRKVQWASAKTGMMPFSRGEVSDDGRRVILRVNGLRPGDRTWIFAGPDQEPKYFTIFEMERRMGGSLHHREVNPYMSGQFDFIWNEKSLYCVWFPGPKKWAVIDLKTWDFVAPDEALSRELEEAATSRALDRVSIHQPGSIKAMLKPLQEKAAEFLPGFQRPAPSRLLMDEALYGSYVFLTARKNPKARKYIEGLLTYPIESKTSGIGYFSPPRFEVSSHERAIGDALWSQWNGLDEVWEEEELGMGGRRRGRKLNYFGVMEGSVQLPIDIPADKPGAVWVYLIPANLEEGDWQNKEAVTTLFCDLDFKKRWPGMGGLNQSSVRDQVRYVFSTVIPGEYRVKAVWDRRPPYASGEERGLPSPGDYESFESDNLTVTAGERFFIDLDCTNRVGVAEEYYAADLLRGNQEAPFIPPRTREGWGYVRPDVYQMPEVPASPADFPPFLPGRATALPLDKFLLVTNRLSREVVLKGITLLDQRLARRPSLGSQEQLEFDFEVNLSGRRLPLSQLTVTLRDQHGCRFHAAPTQFNDQSRGRFKARAPVFPRSGRFYLDVSASGTNPRALASYTITNAAPFETRSWDVMNYYRSADFPVQRDLGDFSVHLFSKPRRGREPAFGFFTPAGEEAPWSATEIQYEDPMGNRAADLVELCAKLPSVKIIATFLPNFTFSFPENQKWTMPIADLPEAGLYRNLNLRTVVAGVEFELLAITGKGQFEYVDGRITSGRAKVDPDAQPGRNALPPLAWDDPKLVFVCRGEGRGGGENRAEVVVSRVPHLAIRVRGLKAGQRWAILEERRPSWRSVYDPPEGFGDAAPWYLALNRAKIAESGQITMVVQDARREAFEVAVSR